VERRGVDLLYINAIFIRNLSRLLFEDLKTNIMKNRNVYVKLWGKNYNNQENLSSYGRDLGYRDIGCKMRQIIQD